MPKGQYATIGQRREPLGLRCIDCGKDFVHTKAGTRPKRCIHCRAPHQKRYMKAYLSRYYETHGEKLRQRVRERYRANPRAVLESNRRSNMKRLYGMTPEDYDIMLERQNGECAICGVKSNGPRRFAIDHCHVTGRVRGLLCDACNGSLGQMNDDPRLFRRAADYLEKGSD